MAIDASLEFHNAIKSANPRERFMFVFDSDTNGESEPSVMNTIMVWTDADVVASAGVRVVEAVNGGNELNIGQTMASTLTMKVFNEQGYLNDFIASLGDYGTGKAYLGVKLADYALSPAPSDANCIAYLGFDGSSGVAVTGHSTAPYLRVGGQGVNIDYAGEGVDYPIGAIIVETPSWAGGQLMITAIPFNPNGDSNIHPYSVYWTEGSTWGMVSTSTWGALANRTWGELFGTVEEVNYPYYVPYMNNYKFPQIAASRKGYTLGTDGVLYEFYPDGAAAKFEYHSLGRFKVNTPHFTNNVIADITAYDRMTMFDKPAAQWLASLTYPLTIGELYDALCEYCEVWNTGSTFTNSTVPIPAAPSVREDLTCRALLGYIAEAACANARMNRDGKVELVFFSTVYLSIDEGNTFSTQIADYVVDPIDRVTLSVPQEGQDNMIVPCGDGTNEYALSDNFLLYGGDFYTIQGWVYNIYQRLRSMLVIPAQILCVCDWTVQAGDYYNYNYVDAAGVTQTKRFPIYKQTIEYNGFATVYYESSGEPRRPTRLTGSPFATANAIARIDSRVSALNRTTAGLARRSAVSNMGLLICAAEAAQAAKTITTAEGNATYVAGTMLVVQFKQGNTAASPTLQIDSSPATPLLNGHTNAAIAQGDVSLGMYAVLVYNGAEWVILNPAQ